MNFSAEEIEIARGLFASELDWEPTAGNYVFDETGFCPQPSPFQERVYFILNYDYFMKRVGGVERFKKIMTWLPTWYDCRQILGSMHVGAAEVVAALEAADALAEGSERVTLYRLIASRLR